MLQGLVYVILSLVKGEYLFYRWIKRENPKFLSREVTEVNEIKVNDVFV